MLCGCGSLYVMWVWFSECRLCGCVSLCVGLCLCQGS